MTTPDPGVIRALRHIQGQVDALSRAVADALDAAEGDPPYPALKKEPTATPATMCAGGWIRIPGDLNWHQIAHVAFCSAHEHPGYCYEIKFRVPRHEPIHVGKWDTLPFLTDEQFQADCDREQAEYRIEAAKDWRDLTGEARR